MMEVAGESRHVPSHAQRTVLFLSAMRHFAQSLRRRAVPLRYVALDDPDNTGAFDTEIARAIDSLRPAEIVCTLPGEWRVKHTVERVGVASGTPVRFMPDEHFLTTPEEFAAWAKGRTSLTMEFFYREQRRRTGYLMQGTGPRAKPEGDVWNFDKDNRLPFGPGGPTPRPRPPVRFEPDDITRSAASAVGTVLSDLPGRTEPFSWPVTRTDALRALDDFITHRLRHFGPFEDAMWTDEPTLYHSTLSAALNLKLLNPRECCDRAARAFHEGAVPLQSAEAFIRQIIGWREFIRGVYWLDMPRLLEANHFGHDRPLPDWYWSGETQMNCLRQAIGQTLRHGYAHHIQRLMVTGNFALLAGLQPRAVHEWYLAVYVDAVEWAELPNTAGMALYANGGRFTSKPYISSGAYIGRMSNYCRGCRYDPKLRSGPRACPFTVLYWNFLDRNEAEFAGNPRTVLMARNIARFDAAERRAIRQSADRILATIPQL